MMFLPVSWARRCLEETVPGQYVLNASRTSKSVFGLRPPKAIAFSALFARVQTPSSLVIPPRPAGRGEQGSVRDGSTD